MAPPIKVKLSILNIRKKKKPCGEVYFWLEIFITKNGTFKRKMVINRYLRYLFGWKKVRLSCLRFCCHILFDDVNAFDDRIPEECQWPAWPFNWCQVPLILCSTHVGTAGQTSTANRLVEIPSGHLFWSGIMPKCTQVKILTVWCRKLDLNNTCNLLFQEMKASLLIPN